MTNTNNASKVDERTIKQIINSLRKRADLTHDKVVEGMARLLGWEFDISRYNRRLDGRTKFDLKELLSLIQLFTSDEIDHPLRCKAEEAFRLFYLSEMPAQHYPLLKPFFEDEYNALAKQYLEVVDGPERQPEARAFQRNMPPYPEMIIGRDDDLIRLMSWLGIGENSRRKPVTVVRGWPGVGKTTLVNRLMYDQLEALNFLELVAARRLHYTLVLYARHLLETNLYELSEA